MSFLTGEQEKKNILSGIEVVMNSTIWIDTKCLKWFDYDMKESQIFFFEIKMYFSPCTVMFFLKQNVLLRCL